MQIFIRAYSRVEAYDYLNGGDVLQQLVETAAAAERATSLYRERHEIGKNRRESI